MGPVLAHPFFSHPGQSFSESSLAALQGKNQGSERASHTETNTQGSASPSYKPLLYLEGGLAIVIADILVSSTEKQDSSTALLLGELEWGSQLGNQRGVARMGHRWGPGAHTPTPVCPVPICTAGGRADDVYRTHKRPTGPESADVHNSLPAVRNTRVHVCPGNGCAHTGPEGYSSQQDTEHAPTKEQQDWTGKQALHRGSCAHTRTCTQSHTWL